MNPNHEHGTLRGYDCHRRRKTTTCQPCRDAMAAEGRRVRAERQDGSGRGLPVHRSDEQTMQFDDWCAVRGYDPQTRTYAGAA